jgi:hypothetical protein
VDFKAMTEKGNVAEEITCDKSDFKHFYEYYKVTTHKTLMFQSSLAFYDHPSPPLVSGSLMHMRKALSTHLSILLLFLSHLFNELDDDERIDLFFVRWGGVEINPHVIMVRSIAVRDRINKIFMAGAD